MSTIFHSEKKNLHPRNKHLKGYKFEELIKAYPALDQYVSLNKYHTLSIDFSNSQAVRALNKALLIHSYNISYWEIPEGFLCPPIPGRADYIHYVADLLASVNNSTIPKGKKIQILDIGVGANCIYPIIGHHEYGWKFMGSDINSEAIRSAKLIVEKNNLNTYIEIRHQSNPSDILKNIIKENERIDLTICNPPFHSSEKEAKQGSERKWRNLKIKKTKGELLNFGGQVSELWSEGGEPEFIKAMISQSQQASIQCLWFTTLVSKSENLKNIYKNLEEAKVQEIQTIAMSQGQKSSRIVAWSFFNKEQQKYWAKTYW